MRDWRSVPFEAPERALCAFAARLTLAPTQSSESGVQELRAVGFDDRAIHDAVQVIGQFNYFTRVAEGLGVEPEPTEFVRAWGELGLECTELPRLC